MNTPRLPALPDTKFTSPAASVRSLTQLLEDDGRTPLASAFSSRPASRSSAAIRGAAEQQLQGLLASKESEAALLRQQLAQLMADFKFNLKLLEERDAELERLDTLLAGLREGAATRDAALQEARRTLSDREAALRDKEARVAALEERQKQLVELCERQVADARESRDEEVARCQQEVALVQGEAAKAKAEVIAGYERQVSAVAASEREARQRAAAVAEENEHVRSQLQRAEARIAEQELAMQRMVSQFEGALATLQQLEAQYEGLAADAGAADALRTSRIAELEREVEGLRASRSALQQERDGSVAQLSAALGEAVAAAAEAKQQYHRAMMDAAELTEALAEVRQEAAQQRERAQVAEQAAAEAQEAVAAAQAALEREGAAHARTSSLLEAARLHHDTARRDAQEQEQLAAQLREAAAVLEAERNDCAKAEQAAEAKVHAAEERAQLLADQLEQERVLHSQLLERSEAEMAARWERALEAAQGERTALQQALDLANRQLQAAHRDTEMLRVQVQGLRLSAGAGLEPLQVPQHRANGSVSVQASPVGHAGSNRRKTSSQIAHAAANSAGCARQATLRGSGGASEDVEGSVAEAGSLPSSHDAFSDVPADHSPPAATQQHQRGSGVRPGANAYQQQLHRHIEALAAKVSSFQCAVEEVRLVGQQASQQLAESASMLPADLQRRQEAVALADQQLQTALAAERQQYQQERQHLDQQVAEQQQLLRQREGELQRLQLAQEEEKQRRLQHQRGQREQEQLSQATALQDLQQLEQQRQHPHEAEVAAGSRYTAAGPAGRAALLQSPPAVQDFLKADPSQPRATLQLPLLSASVQSGSSMGQGSYGTSLLPGRLAPASSAAPPAPSHRRSVSAALAAANSSSRPASSVPKYGAVQGATLGNSNHSAVMPAALQQPPLHANGLRMPAMDGSSKTAPLRATVGALQHVTRDRISDEAPAAAAHEDPLSRARRQVLAAKQYLASVAELGSRPPGSPTAN